MVNLTKRDLQLEAYEAHTAEHEGRATPLMNCYLCDPDTGPLRGVVRTFIGGGSDPTEVYVLRCGHMII